MEDAMEELNELAAKKFRVLSVDKDGPVSASARGTGEMRRLRRKGEK
jgi:hypothetical protein